MKPCIVLLCEAHVVLGVPRTATKKAIKERFMELAKKHHPDVPGGNAVEFKKYREAFENMIEGVGKRGKLDGEWYEQKMGTATRTGRKMHAEWAEPNMSHKEAYERYKSEQIALQSRLMFIRLFLTFCFGSFVAVLISFDRDDDGLSWIEKPHPAILAARSRPTMPLHQRKLLEERINKALQETDDKAKVGNALIPVPGIGHIDYQAGRIVRSQTYRQEILMSEAPPPIARWKAAAPTQINTVEHQAGVPPVRPISVHTTPENTQTAQQQYEQKIADMERELEALKNKQLAAAVGDDVAEPGPASTPAAPPTSGIPAYTTPSPNNAPQLPMMPHMPHLPPHPAHPQATVEGVA